MPDDTKWSLTERPGFLRLHSLPATDFWWARNSLTQRAIGPQSTPTTVLETAGMKPGDVAGLALLNRPYAWIGVRRGDDGFWLEQFDQLTGDTARVRADDRPRVAARRLRLPRRAMRASATPPTARTSRRSARRSRRSFSSRHSRACATRCSTTTRAARPAATPTSTRCACDEPHPRGLTRPIPVGRTITLHAAGRDTPFALDGQTRFTVVDRKLGRVALRAGNRYVSIAPVSDSTSAVSLRAGRAG